MARTRVTVAMQLLYTSAFLGFVAEGFTPTTLGAVRSAPLLHHHRSATAARAGTAGHRRDRRPAVHVGRHLAPRARRHAVLVVHTRRRRMGLGIKQFEGGRDTRRRLAGVEVAVQTGAGHTVAAAGGLRHIPLRRAFR